MHEEYMDEAALSDLLYDRSGLLNISEISGDMSLPAVSVSMRQ
jgi:acetate kinase